MKYKEYLCTAEWWARRNRAVERAGGYCENCLSSRATCVHHLTYERVFNELPDDLIALCDSCHEGVHSGSFNVCRKQRSATSGFTHFTPIARELWELANLRPSLLGDILRSVREWEDVLDCEVYQQATSLLSGDESAEVFATLAAQQTAKAKFIKTTPEQRWECLKNRMNQRMTESQLRRQFLESLEEATN